MPKVVWTVDNDRKLLIRLIERSAKSYDTVELAKLFPGATPKAIEERIAKLKREAKAGDGKAIARPGGKSRPKKRLAAGAKSKATRPGFSGPGFAGPGRVKRNPTFSLVLPNNFECGGELRDDEDPMPPGIKPELGLKQAESDDEGPVQHMAQNMAKLLDMDDGVAEDDEMNEEGKERLAKRMKTEQATVSDEHNDDSA